MTLNYDSLMELGAADVPCDYSERDSLLYALGVGFGADPTDERELPYVVETLGRYTVPTMATESNPAPPSPCLVSVALA